MKILKINNKDVVLKFTTKAIMNLNAKDITLTTLSNDMEKLNLISLYDAFYEGLKFANSNMTINDVYELIDLYFEEGNTVEDFFLLVLEEYSSAMGLGKHFKEQVKQLN